jgi:AraC-like DNA-binding protein
MLTERAPGREFPRHCHDEYVLTLLYAGAEPFHHGRQFHLAPKGAVITVNPGEWHSNGLLPGVEFEYKTVYPSVGLMRRMTGSHSSRELTFERPVWQQPTISQALRVLHQALESEAGALECETAFLELIGCFLCDQEQPAPSRGHLDEPAFVQLVRDYLAANLASPTTLADLSELAGVSPFHLLRMFRDTVGIPPHQFQNHLRVAEAKRLLREGRPAGDVAVEVGFSDQSHLNRHFLRYVGVTPGRFAKNSNSVQVFRSPHS